ncbi:protein GPR107 [Chrysoperla carnea]|uniref:protein GPR107 n=1 Tax=Chrysoperla carnea TaxID=189513 RepID=UPI001D08CB1D|nr:protein GPR107 [Chrysoperla carnea]
MLYKFLYLLFLIFPVCFGRIHKLEIRNDVRRYIALSTFGFYKGGYLDVKLKNFRVKPEDETSKFGFSLDRTMNDAMNPYLDSHQENCLLQNFPSNGHDSSVVYFTLNFKSLKLDLNCSEQLRQKLHIYKDKNQIRRLKRHSLTEMSDSSLFLQKRETQGLQDDTFDQSANQIFRLQKIEGKDGYNYYNTNFVMWVASEAEEGLYNLYFHSCPNYEKKTVALNFDMEIEEQNYWDSHKNYLSAGEMPLPALYFMMSLLFFLSGCFWVFILHKSSHPVFKIHYLMAVLVYLKSLSLLFHGINYHFIETKGEHVAAWAILYYVAHLLKGAVLFITIVLIGTGWTFIKHILADKDKKLFMIVIPLQVLANVADIIIAESEEGDMEHKTWLNIFVLVDLMCCGAILFPVVWSIRHLQEASQTDGKAAINLRKLKLFRHFYIMIVCYIYFTRIIVYLLRITVPFQYEWLDEMFKEMATYVFFVLTGYKFRPASANPYFMLSFDDDDDEEIDIVITEADDKEGFTKLVPRNIHKSAILESTDEEKDNLINKRESSHEYD